MEAQSEVSYQTISQTLLTELQQKEVYRRLGADSIFNSTSKGIFNNFHDANFEATLTSILLNSILNNDKTYKLSVEKISPTVFLAQSTISNIQKIQDSMSTSKIAEKVKDMLSFYPEIQTYLITSFIPRLFVYGNTNDFSKEYYEFIKALHEKAGSDLTREVIAYYILYDQIFISKLYRAMESGFQLEGEFDNDQYINLFVQLFNACLPFMEGYRQEALIFFYEKEGKDGANSIIFKTLLPLLLRVWQNMPAFLFSQSLAQLTFPDHIEYDIGPELARKNRPLPIRSFGIKVPFFYTELDNAIYFIMQGNDTEERVKRVRGAGYSPLIIKQSEVSISGLNYLNKLSYSKIPEIAALTLKRSINTLTLLFNQLKHRAEEMGVDPICLIPGIEEDGEGFFRATESADEETVFHLACLANIERHTIKAIESIIKQEAGVAQPALTAIARVKELSSSLRDFNGGLLRIVFSEEKPQVKVRRAGPFVAVADLMMANRDRAIEDMISIRFTNIKDKGAMIKKMKITERAIAAFKGAVRKSRDDVMEAVQFLASLLNEIGIATKNFDLTVLSALDAIERGFRIASGALLDNIPFDVLSAVDFEDTETPEEGGATADISRAPWVLSTVRSVLTGILMNANQKDKLLFFTRAIALDELYDRSNFVNVINVDTARYLMQTAGNDPVAYAVVLGEAKETARLLKEAIDAGLPFEDLGENLNKFVSFLTGA